MNSKKRGLIVAAGILNILTAIFLGICAVLCFFYFDKFVEFLNNQLLTEAVITGLSVYRVIILVSFGICAFLSLIGGWLLLFSVRKKGSRFEKSKTSFIVGSIFTILLGLISIPAILIYCSFALKDDLDQVKKSSSTDNIIHSNPRNEAFKLKVERLRKLRDKGEISEDEFKQMLSDLL